MTAGSNGAFSQKAGYNPALPGRRARISIQPYRCRKDGEFVGSPELAGSAVLVGYLTFGFRSAELTSSPFSVRKGWTPLWVESA